MATRWIHELAVLNSPTPDTHRRRVGAKTLPIRDCLSAVVSPAAVMLTAVCWFL